MIKAVNLAQRNQSFRSNPEDKAQHQDETRILPSSYKTKMKQEFQKTSSAFLDYPVKGLKGDINSNFYEFLTMGIIIFCGRRFDKEFTKSLFLNSSKSRIIRLSSVFSSRAGFKSITNL